MFIDHNTCKQILTRIKVSKATLHHGVQYGTIAKNSTKWNISLFLGTGCTQHAPMSSRLQSLFNNFIQIQI